MKTTIYIPDITCDSCTKVISRTLQKEGIKEVQFRKDGIDVTYDDTKTSAQNIISDIKAKGYRAGLTPFPRKTIKERIRDMRSNKAKYRLEMRGISYAVISFLILLLLQVLAYIGFLRNIPHFASDFGIWMIYLAISICTLGFALWHINAYKTNHTHMVGMMIGMTLGMQTGMLIGSIVGAINGFFIGSLVGMIGGVTIGSAAGKCCGIMGIMEGMMAGVMGGTMGPMISVMMLTDHLNWFMPLFVIINVAILLGLSYMMYEEVIEHTNDIARSPADFATFLSLCIMAFAIIAGIMIYAPHAPITGINGG